MGENTIENVKTRIKARKVITADLIMTILGLVFIIVIFCLSLIGKANGLIGFKVQQPNITESEDSSNSTINNIVKVSWECVALAFLCVNFCAGILLFLKTKPESDPVKALRAARIWSTINIMFILVVIAFAAYMGTLDVFLGAKTVLPCILRGIFLFFVWPFIKELKEMLGGNSKLPES